MLRDVNSTGFEPISSRLLAPRMGFRYGLRWTFLKGTSLVGSVSNWISELGIYLRNELQNFSKVFHGLSKKKSFLNAERSSDA